MLDSVMDSPKDISLRKLANDAEDMPTNAKHIVTLIQSENGEECVLVIAVFIVRNQEKVPCYECIIVVAVAFVIAVCIGK